MGRVDWQCRGAAVAAGSPLVAAVTSKLRMAAESYAYSPPYQRNDAGLAIMECTSGMAGTYVGPRRQFGDTREEYIC